MNYDVIIVGCGIAGLAAACSAAEEGVKVGLVERATKEESGGNTRYTQAFLRIKSNGEVRDDFEDQLAGASNPTIDPALLQHSMKPYEEWPPLLKAYAFTDSMLIKAFADGVPESIAWLCKQGITLTPSWPWLGEPQRMAPSGGGLAIIEILTQRAEELGVHFHYETVARSLVQNQKGDVRGLRAWCKYNGVEELGSKAVVLACGGFEGNLEMSTKYLGLNAHFLRPVCRGGMYNKGEGIEMALKIGAAPAGQYDNFLGEPIDPRSGKAEASVMYYIFGILVNKLGKRFMDEGSEMLEWTLGDIPRAIINQPGGIAYIIYDLKKVENVPLWEKLGNSDKQPIRAGSIGELASKIEVNPAELERTIKSFNSSVQDGKFEPLKLDGKCTKGIEPPKSNWALLIDENDLYCYPIVASNVFTFGGLKVTSNSEVVNLDGSPIPGLYAAGETVGMFYEKYIGSISVLRGLVFGRMAGKHSATQIASGRL